MTKVVRETMQKEEEDKEPEGKRTGRPRKRPKHNKQKNLEIEHNALYVAGTEVHDFMSELEKTGRGTKMESAMVRFWGGMVRD